MRVSKVSFGFTKNMGNYESMRVDTEVELREDESFDDALTLACGAVHEALAQPLTTGEIAALQDERYRVSVAQERRS